MKSANILTIIVLSLLTISTVSGQDFLNTYFKGNKDSLLAEASKLVNMPKPTFRPFAPSESGKNILVDKSLRYKTVNHYFLARDKHKIFAYRFPKKSPNIIILIHGVKSVASDYLKTAAMLQQAGQAEVYGIDLRGHGKWHKRKSGFKNLTSFWSLHWSKKKRRMQIPLKESLPC